MTAALRKLRRFVRARPAREERCDLCGAPVDARHEHLVDPARRELKCACTACALLFPEREGARLLRVPRRAERLEGVVISDAEWSALGIPIGLAFFLHSSAVNEVVAFYPSPAGTTESRVPTEAWSAIARGHPVLAALQPDIEALLVDRVSAAREHFRVSIDECYRLAGILRQSWRGLHGGEAAQQRVRAFFDELRGGARA
jgi:hypothetical protein